MGATDVTTRLISPDDAEVLARLESENREYLLAGAPLRSDDYFTVAGQRDAITHSLKRYDAGTNLPFVIEADGAVVGRITLNAIVRGILQSANVGYWVDRSVAGRGITSAALAQMVAHSFGELGLHRLEAGTTVTNDASARVLVKAGFEQYGVAPAYLLIGGRWQDHRLFQLINEEWSPRD
ncbi:MAG TPA: GNAT family protein [Marmoricola sp.]|nr:GNAT family protein [Marmoricola sp.]